MFKTIYFYTKDKYITEDAVQQAFVIAYKNLNQLKSKDKFDSWVTSLGTDVYEVTIEYSYNDIVIVFSQQNCASGTSRGSVYDTDDTVVKDLTVNGSPAILYLSKNNISTLNWQTRGLLLQITGKIDETEILKIANLVN